MMTLMFGSRDQNIRVLLHGCGANDESHRSLPCACVLSRWPWRRRMEVIQKSVATAVVEAYKELHMARMVTGGEVPDGDGRQGVQREASRIHGVGGGPGPVRRPGDEVTEENQGYSSNLYFVWAQRTKGDSFNVVKNVVSQNGGEAWRKLCRRFSGKTRGRDCTLSARAISNESQEAQ